MGSGIVRGYALHRESDSNRAWQRDLLDFVVIWSDDGVQVAARRRDISLTLAI